MAAGADSIDDLDVIRAGGMTKLFGGVYAAATLGIFLREVTHGYVRPVFVPYVAMWSMMFGVDLLSRVRQKKWGTNTSCFL